MSQIYIESRGRETSYSFFDWIKSNRRLLYQEKNVGKVRVLPSIDLDQNTFMIAFGWLNKFAIDVFILLAPIVNFYSKAG